MMSLALIFILMLVSGIFSGLETAVTSLSLFRIQEKKTAHKLRFILRHKEEFITTLLIANNITIVASALLLERLVVNLPPLLQGSCFLLQIFVFFIFAEFIPKALFSKISASILRAFFWPLFVLFFIFYPISRGVAGLSQKLGGTQKKPPYWQEYYHFFNAYFESSESMAVEPILRFGQTRLVEIMKPLKELISLEKELSVASARKICAQYGYTRFPVFEARGDKIIGYVHVLDLLKTQAKEKIASLVRKALFMPEFLTTKQALPQLQAQKQALLFTVNEFGSVTGMVTREDFLEEITGEFTSSDQPQEEEEIQILKKGKYLVTGTTDIDLLQDKTGLKLPKGGYETIGGFLMKQAGKIPTSGFTYQNKFALFKVLEANEYGVDKIQITLIPHK